MMAPSKVIGGKLKMAFALGLVLGAGRAFSAGLNVSPVQVALTPEDPRALISLRNEGPAEARYQITAVTWGEDPEKGMVLAPTQDIVFFPALLTIGPGETKNVRIGTAAPFFGQIEKTYRVFVEELPAAEKPQAKPAVRVLTRVGIPVFVAPVKAVSSRRLSPLNIGAGKAVVDVQNGGTVHFRVESVRLEGRGAKGEKAFETQLAGWYVLAGGHKPYELEIPKDGCALARKLVVFVKADEQELQEELETPRGACGP
jgi:fimbrial chaperone protein